jgi:hypothetical protein
MKDKIAAGKDHGDHRLSTTINKKIAEKFGISLAYSYLCTVNRACFVTEKRE